MIMGKILYNLEIWGHVSQKFCKIIDKIMIKCAMIMTKFTMFGRTDEKILNSIGWLPFRQTVKLASFKLAYKIINSQDNNHIQNEMLINRNIRYKAEKNRADSPNTRMDKEISADLFIFY